MPSKLDYHYRLLGAIVYYMVKQAGLETTHLETNLVLKSTNDVELREYLNIDATGDEMHANKVFSDVLNWMLDEGLIRGTEDKAHPLGVLHNAQLTAAGLQTIGAADSIGTIRAEIEHLDDAPSDPDWYRKIGELIGGIVVSVGKGIGAS